MKTRGWKHEGIHEVGRGAGARDHDDRGGPERRRSLPVARRRPGRKGPELGQGAQREVDRAPRGPQGIQADLRAHAGDPGLEGEDPDSRPPRRDGLQLLEGRRARAGHLAAHVARLVPFGLARVGDGPRPRRAREGGRQGLGLARRAVPPAGQRAVHGEALARRLGRLRGARVRHGHEAVRRGRLLASRGQVPRRPGGTRTRCGSGRTSVPARSRPRVTRGS